ncbi:PQQ-like domain-containing protein [Saccharicrinis carchari]|uniref:PQQ-like domain-containing protein n=1 Tax=Saccharicrinis carchari TaxID=1168039 RepID=A0A521B3U3_SACCC|nr:PQQ-binding-like beta-propeller repeat protein [Saccharicrinis carchari]SMO41691.1 PQQ-like domain-containing protein [Saccharicrinis carchari]
MKVHFYPKAILLLLLSVLLWSCQSSDSVKFAFLTDIHVVPGNENEMVFARAVGEINRSDANFVVITGDLSNMGSDAELNAVKAILDSLNKPYYILPGNHETNWSETGGATYKKVFGDDRFDFNQDTYRFVGFNTGPYMKMGDGHVKQEDMAWLQKTLSSGDKSKHIIAMAHYPLADGLDNWPEITETLKQQNVKMALCGHGHKLQMMNFNGITGIMGRALLSRDKTDQGYNLVELKGDSVWVSEKKLGQTPEQMFAWNIHESKQIEGLSISELPNYDINKQFERVAVKWDYTDSASVLGGFDMHPSGMLAWLSSDGYLRCINKTDKQMLWEHHLGTPQYGTPVFYKNMLIVGTSQGKVRAFNVADGMPVWETEFAHPIFGEGVVDGDQIFISLGKGGMASINASNGTLVWQFNDVEGFVQVKPCVTYKEVIFGAWDRHLYCVDKTTGKLNWKWNNGHGAILYSPGNVVPAVAKGKVFLVAPDRYFTVLDLKTGKQLYRTNEHQVRESMGMSADKEYMFAKLMNDTVVAYPTDIPEKGELWALDCGFGYEHNPCPMIEQNGVLYGGTKNGEVFAINTDGGQLIYRYKLGNSSVNKLMLNREGNLMVMLMEGHIFELAFPFGEEIKL